jgi:dTDP-4-amino-4,6-dideoxygalactose transaminase
VLPSFRILQHIFNADVSVNVHFIPVPMLSFYKNLGYQINKYPVTYDNYSREITLPVYYDLSDANIQIVVEAVVNAVERVISN